MHPRLRMVLIGLVACAAAAVAGVWLADGGQEGTATGRTSGFAGAVRPPGAMAPELSGLRDQDGETVRMAAYRGRPVVMTFVYSTCRDTCPVMVDQIRGALDRLGSDVPVLGVSVDPANDTATRAKRFLLDRRMTGRMRFLLGSRADLAPVWRAYGIAPQRGDEDHSAYVVLVDGQGRQRVGFPSSVLTPEGLADDLQRLARG